MEKIINLTPHTINILGEEPIQSSGLVRLAVTTEEAGLVAGIRTTCSVFGDPVGLPEPTPGTFFIVSQIVKSALPERKDLLVPSEIVRNSEGQIVGCKSLGR